MPHLFRVDRVRGCLLGMAVGDALGAPLEGLTSQQIKTHYGRVRNYVDGVQAWKRKPYRWRLRGLYSDDTQQALALCDVLLDYRRVDQERLADLYLALMTPKGSFVGAHRGIGRSFRQVLAALERGVPAHLTGQPTAGIGAAMRIAPVPLYFGDETGPMFDSVMAASLMTHRDIRSLSGALAVAHAIRRLVAGEPRDPSLLFWVASDLVKDEKQIAAAHGDIGHQDRPARRQPVAGHRPRRVAARRAARACPGGAGRRSQSARRRARLQASDHGFPAGLHPDLPLPPADDRQLRGSRDRGRQPGRRYRHCRGDPRGHGRGLLRGRRDPAALARRSAESRRASRPGPSRWPSGRPAGLHIPDLVATEHVSPARKARASSSSPRSRAMAATATPTTFV